MIFKRGYSGENIKNIQVILRKVGYDIAKDGDFGPVTEDAVKKYQKLRGIGVTGIVEGDTLFWLKKDGLVLENTNPSPVVGEFITKMKVHSNEFLGFVEKVSNAAWDDPKLEGWQKDTSDKLIKYMSKIQGWEKGAPYCAGFVGAVIILSLEDLKISTEKFIDLWTAHVMTNVRYAKSNKVLSAYPSLGSIWLAKYGSTDSGHTGIVLDILGDYIITIEGNTSAGPTNDPVLQRSGDGIYKRKFTKEGRGALKTQGFISAENIFKHYV